MEMIQKKPEGPSPQQTIGSRSEQVGSETKCDNLVRDGLDPVHFPQAPPPPAPTPRGIEVSGCALGTRGKSRA